MQVEKFGAGIKTSNFFRERPIILIGGTVWARLMELM